MSREAIERVPVVDWLMGLVVLACGVAAVVVAWRYGNRLSGLVSVVNDEPDEGGGEGPWDPPLALPPGPALRVVAADAVDEELWGMIDAERRRLPEPAAPDPPKRIAAEALPPSRGRAEQVVPVPIGTATPRLAAERRLVELTGEETHDRSMDDD